MADIEHLALKIQDQSQELRQQSLSDPLTGIFNRRYFDLMLAHLHRAVAPPTTVDAGGDRPPTTSTSQRRIRSCGGRPGIAGDSRLPARGCARPTSSPGSAATNSALILTNMAGDRLGEWLIGLIHDHDHRLLETRPALPLCRLSVGAAQIDAHIYPQPADAFNAADSTMYGIKQRRDIRHSRFAIARDTSRAAAVTLLMDAL